MSTFFGWEAGNLNNNGASILYSIPTTVPGGGLSITGVQLTIAAASGSNMTGFAELLSYGFAFGAGPDPTFSPPSYQVEGLTASPLISPGTISAPSSVRVGNGGTPQYCLFSVILKGWIENQPLDFKGYIPVNSLWVPAGGWIVLHMDHAGTGPLDCEMQGTFDGVCNGSPF